MVSSKQKKTRLTLEFDDNTRQLMEELKQKIGATSITEVIRRSIAVYLLISEHYERDGAVTVLHKDGTRERFRV
jgi:hypothetical protein